MKSLLISSLAFCVYCVQLIVCAPSSLIASDNDRNVDGGLNTRGSETEDVNNNLSGSNGPTAALNFLRKFGYLDPLESNSSETLYTEGTVSSAIRLMQRFGALPETGQLDNATLSLLTKPRCGVPDIVHSRNKRFVLNSKGWNKRTLSYRIENYSSKLGESEVSQDIIRALKVWADYAHLRFVKKSRESDNVDISISFGSRQHGDRYPFDGPGGTLAHAFYPQDGGGLGGDIHFDEDEDWYSPGFGSPKTSADKRHGISFLSVAIHELGHSLGLGHSHIQGSVMFPYYQLRESGSPRLDYDDIMALYHLYILRNLSDGGDEESESTSEKSSSPTTQLTQTTSSSEMPASSTPNTRTTSETSQWTSITSRSTKLSGSGKPGSTEGIDPELTTSTTKYGKGDSLPDLCKDEFDTIAFIRNEIFVFTGEYMWRFKKRGELALGGYPAKISTLFPVANGLEKIDAAFERESDSKIIFISGKFYWTFDGTSPSGPSPITEFGLPASLNGVDAAFIWKNGMTYFFRDNLYWKYNETSNTIGADYPKEIERWRGAPDRLTSVIKYKDEETYFFKHDDFWRFDDSLVQTVEGFPMKTSQIWFNC